ncbi:MAG: mandelate racemase/muconate lactonizing enzyme family protein [Pseudomonadota bacterium]
MRITRIAIYKKPLSYVGGTYVWGSGNKIDIAMSSIVTIDTDAGISGCGEFCPCGENYMGAHSHGVEAAARLLAPILLGENPCQVGKIETIMDATIGGHGYAKSPFDAACWDILGKATDQPVWMLMGGKLTDGVPLYQVAPQKCTEETNRDLSAFREQGYQQFQVKVGCDWSADIDRILEIVPLINGHETAIADANQGWRVDHALRVGRATKHLDYVLEQPCKSYHECQQVRRTVDLPMELDECVTDMQVARQIVADHGADIVCLKISNVGGISKARRIRDFLVDSRYPVVCEDTWGGQIATAALSHLATSTPSEFNFNTTDLENYVVESTGISQHHIANGKYHAPDVPGIGVEPDFEALGDPVAIYEANI